MPSSVVFELAPPNLIIQPRGILEREEASADTKLDHDCEGKKNSLPEHSWATKKFSDLRMITRKQGEKQETKENVGTSQGKCMRNNR